MKYHLTRVSGNSCTGPIPVSMTSQESCPNSCPLKNEGCYAKYGPIAIAWRKVDEERGITFSNFLKKIRALPNGQLWRHNQAGDLPGKGEEIDTRALTRLVAANRNKKGFAFTHKPVLDNKKNCRAIAEANKEGFTINLSANNVQEVDSLVALGAGPVVTILPEGTTRPMKTEAGNTIIVCPQKLGKPIQCLTCQLCAHPTRKAVVGFPIHGTGKKYWIKLQNSEGKNED